MALQMFLFPFLPVQTVAHKSYFIPSNRENFLLQSHVFAIDTIVESVPRSLWALHLFALHKRVEYILYQGTNDKTCPERVVIVVKNPGRKADAPAATGMQIHLEKKR